MAKKKSAEVTVKFRSPSFIHKGVKHLSKDVESAAKKGDEDAMQIIAELVAKKSGVIIVSEEVEQPKPSKAGKGKKDADPADETDEDGESEKEDQDA